MACHKAEQYHGGHESLMASFFSDLIANGDEDEVQAEAQHDSTIAGPWTGPKDVNAKLLKSPKDVHHRM